MKIFILQNLQSILLYFLIINACGFFAMGIDKYKAQKGMWRTKEKTLFTLAIIGGSIGTLCGMYIFRHKTKHSSFVYGFPMILTAQIVIVGYLLFKY